MDIIPPQQKCPGAPRKVKLVRIIYAGDQPSSARRNLSRELEKCSKEKNKQTLPHIK